MSSFVQHIKLEQPDGSNKNLLVIHIDTGNMPRAMAENYCQKIASSYDDLKQKLPNTEIMWFACQGGYKAPYDLKLKEDEIDRVKVLLRKDKLENLEEKT